jgi:predicted Zn-ribbon and HTH transcriptional regulator
MRLTSTLHPCASATKAERVRSHERGRVCAQSECATVLSIYNPTSYCAVHAQSAARARRYRSQELAVREATCAHCGTSFETLNQARRFCSDRCRMAAFARRKRAALRSKLDTGP